MNNYGKATKKPMDSFLKQMSKCNRFVVCLIIFYTFARNISPLNCGLPFKNDHKILENEKNRIIVDRDFYFRRIQYVRTDAIAVNG